MGCFDSDWLTKCGEKNVLWQEGRTSLQPHWGPGYLSSSQRGGKPPFSVYFFLSLISLLSYSFKSKILVITLSTHCQCSHWRDFFLARVSEQKFDLLFLHGKVGHKHPMASVRSWINNFVVWHHLFLTMNLLPKRNWWEMDGISVGGRCASELRTASDHMASQRVWAGACLKISLCMGPRLQPDSY